MSAKGRSQDTINGMAHRHYPALVATGDGVKTEFALPRTVLRLGDETVLVAGVLMRATDATGAYDYAVRGLTAGYSGDSNTIKLAVAPLVGVEVTLTATGG